MGMTCAIKCGQTSSPAPKLSQMSANIGIAIMPANAKLLHSQPSRQIWLGGHNARGMYAEDIDKIQKNLRSFRYRLKSR